MTHRHRQRPVGARLGRQPVVGELHVIGVVGRDDDDLLAAVARLGHEVRVRRARDRQVRAPHDQVARVPPVRRLGHVGLVAEHLRRRRRQIRVPVVERRRVPADQRQEARAGGERHRRHRRDRREPADPVRAVLADRVHRRGGDQLARLLPVAAHQPAAAALTAIAAVRRDLRRTPRPDQATLARAARQSSSRLPRTYGYFSRAGEYVYHENDAPRGQPRGSWFGPVGIGARVVDRLRLPRDQPVLDVHVPRARAGAVDAVRRAHDLVVAPAVAIRGLPAAAAARSACSNFRRTGEYVYHENDAPRGQPRGSWFGRSGSVRG